jgi:DNA-binding XRE family transcriptional regulator
MGDRRLEISSKVATLRQRFGKRLREIRVQRRMAQEQFAETLDISVDFLSFIERGRRVLRSSLTWTCILTKRSRLASPLKGSYKEGTSSGSIGHRADQHVSIYVSEDASDRRSAKSDADGRCSCACGQHQQSRCRRNSTNCGHPDYHDQAGKL